MSHLQESHFFAMLSRMKYINRWGLMRNTRQENICEHSLETAIIAHAIALIGNKRFEKNYNCERVALLAMYHDVPEIITGDLPTPVKYHSPEIRKAYGQVENLAIDRLTAMLPEDIRGDYRDIMTLSGENDREYELIIKAADKISAIIKCIEEKNSGNREFIKAEQSLKSTVENIELPEAKAFIEEFLSSYELTLDEQE